ncbi:hypothetical protein HD553DRAFT_307616 [Filobasidium floriforme]|uniref:uncharacterized protein n=1 Tax=Filobasidium floriforme TaxID=5210 RepID=UPI001E8CADDB|nr:uncharacterized protein HD553DRAFT_307616 [Filobasidium floriforme]KAH8088198.1 hypothetical protein HD553DRAFT_307616 [Filobasidium floriforme]
MSQQTVSTSNPTCNDPTDHHLRDWSESGVNESMSPFTDDIGHHDGMYRSLSTANPFSPSQTLGSRPFRAGAFAPVLEPAADARESLLGKFLDRFQDSFEPSEKLEFRRIQHEFVFDSQGVNFRHTSYWTGQTAVTPAINLMNPFQQDIARSLTSYGGDISKVAIYRRWDDGPKMSFSEWKVRSNGDNTAEWICEVTQSRAGCYRVKKKC